MPKSRTDFRSTIPLYRNHMLSTYQKLENVSFNTKQLIMLYSKNILCYFHFYLFFGLQNAQYTLQDLEEFCQPNFRDKKVDSTWHGYSLLDLQFVLYFCKGDRDIWFIYKFLLWNTIIFYHFLRHRILTLSKIN